MMDDELPNESITEGKKTAPKMKSFDLLGSALKDVPASNVGSEIRGMNEID